MESYLLEWASFLVRSLHVVTAIAWIGASFYFIWLDNSLTKPTSDELIAKGVDGELWAVHGGGFYNPQKYLIAPPQLPTKLHWFYWESYSTWLSGFGLFVLVYLFNPKAYLIDPIIFAMSPTWAIILALSFLIYGFLAYEMICRVLARHNKLLAGTIALFIAFSCFLAAQFFSGRALFLLTGAMMATIMTANVLMIIIPGQRRVVAAMKAGYPANPRDGMRGKQRSIHNSYFTLPVLFAMLSHHSSMLYTHKYNWIILIVMMTAAALIRHFFILRHKNKSQLWYPALAALLIASLIIALAPRRAEEHSAQSTPLTRPTLAEVKAIVVQRCQPCHSSQPSLVDAPPKNLILETTEQLLMHAPALVEQAVKMKAMPPGNLTQMTDQERDLIAVWYEHIGSEP